MPITTTLLACMILAQAAEQAPAEPPSLTPVTLQLNWVAEPEFGGLFAAVEDGIFERAGFKVRLLQGAGGTPTCTLVAAGTCDYSVAQADQILLARASGQDVVGLFATFQHAPTAIMLHDANPAQTLAQAWTSGLTIEIEPGLPFVRHMNDMLGDQAVTLVSRSPGVATFERDLKLGVVCWCSSEPITLLRNGIQTKCLMVSDCGFDPYTTVLICTSKRVDAEPDRVKAFVDCVREGWAAYLANPGPYHARMAKLNRAMDEQAMDLSAKAQRPLIMPEGTAPSQLGRMDARRWQSLTDQMVESGILRPDFDASGSWVEWDPEASAEDAGVIPGENPGQAEETPAAQPTEEVAP
jgi:NitT/TauT family transport system substrate-binding protein